MPQPLTLPSNTAAECFPDDFGTEQIDLVPIDIETLPYAFQPFPLTVTLRSAKLKIGLVPPLEMIVAAPSGKHTSRVLDDIPLVVAFVPGEGGPHFVTLREQVHNRWHGSITVDVIGEKKQ